MRLTFLGAAHEVTGSCYLVETERVKFLVDCGMFQGGRIAERRNGMPFHFAPRDIAFVLLTHAHIDHSGLLPKLAAEGFCGQIYTTAATADLIGVLLPDSAHIQEMEAERAQRHQHTRRREDTQPVYTTQQALACLEQVAPQQYDVELSPHPAVRCIFREAGHILGSALIEVWLEEDGKRTKLVFSGDLGQPGRPILRDTATIRETDLLLVESTYGDRLHKDMASTIEEFVHAVNDTLHRKKGNVIIPAFAVGRTQEILYLFNDLTRQGRFRNLNIYVDSPMATEATNITMHHMELFDQEAKDLEAWRAKHLNQIKLTFTAGVLESMALNEIRSGAVIISASGMCDAGRIKHHSRHNLGRRENTILITGFQAQGSLGRRLVDGAKTVRIFGEEIPVRAEIYTIGGLSAHADQAALLHWLRQFQHAPRHTFVVHGEHGAAETLKEHIEKMGWPVTLPALGEVFRD
ncbi:MAG: MBL fold metallo-hydrolase [Sulfuricellaceae bacterium]